MTEWPQNFRPFFIMDTDQTPSPVIPQAAGDAIAHLLPQQVMLHTPNHFSTTVSIHLVDGKSRFVGGWEHFSRGNRTPWESMLLFTPTAGRTLEVRTFDSTGTEIIYPPPLWEQ
jgi:hypothetical protein